MNKLNAIRIMDFSKWYDFFSSGWRDELLVWLTDIENYGRSQLIRNNAADCKKNKNITDTQARLFALELSEKKYWNSIYEKNKKKK